MGVVAFSGGVRAAPLLLPPDHGAYFARRFNDVDEEAVVNLISNAEAAAWLADQAPRFDCPSTRFVETYYFRWWSFRKHIKQTPQGRVLTEFITPVSHAGAFNTVSCALGHHIAEGRWLNDVSLLDEYLHFWFRGGADGGPQPHLHRFSSWAAAAIDERRRVTGDDAFAIDLLPDLIADYRLWEQERSRDDGLFWQHDVRDGMEESISGGRRKKNLRPTINAYMAGNAAAIASIAQTAGRHDLAESFHGKAGLLRAQTIEALWDSRTQFFKVRLESGELSDVREAIGYIPWIFGVAGPEHGAAWTQVRDRRGFWAPRGLTTAERRHPAYRSHGVGTCEWDGAVWPFATSQTLDAMAMLLRGPDQPYVSRRDYFEQLLRYAESHEKDGVAYIGEYHDEVTGEWLITGPKEKRSRFYNHSTFCDLVINGLVGIVPCEGDRVSLFPLLPEDAWDWFCLEGVPYHGRRLTVVWDRTGSHYSRGAGLSLWCDGQPIARSPRLAQVTAKLPKESGVVQPTRIIPGNPDSRRSNEKSS